MNNWIQFQNMLVNLDNVNSIEDIFDQDDKETPYKIKISFTITYGERLYVNFSDKKVRDEQFSYLKKILLLES